MRHQLGMEVESELWSGLGITQVPSQVTYAELFPAPDTTLRVFPGFRNTSQSQLGSSHSFAWN